MTVDNLNDLKLSGLEVVYGESSVLIYKKIDMTKMFKDVLLCKAKYKNIDTGDEIVRDVNPIIFMKISNKFYLWDH